MLNRYFYNIMKTNDKSKNKSYLKKNNKFH